MISNVPSFSDSLTFFSVPCDGSIIPCAASSSETSLCLHLQTGKCKGVISRGNGLQARTVVLLVTAMSRVSEDHEDGQHKCPGGTGAGAAGWGSLPPYPRCTVSLLVVLFPAPAGRGQV